MEARDCVGGRLKTDHDTFQIKTTSTHNGGGTNTSTSTKRNTVPFPVDLGANWIHGISLNPLTELAKEAGVEMVPTSEEVKLLAGDMKAVNIDDDVRIGELFNNLLDRGAKGCWKQNEYNYKNRNQKATRWYAEYLTNKGNHEKTPRPTDVPTHRHSSDSSVDIFLGKALEDRYAKSPSKLSPIEQNLLLWNTKNAEYALGANISDLSMKYWDADDIHAYGGEHVLLKGGFASLADHLLKKCEKYGRRFKLLLNCPVNKIYYALNSSSYPYPKKHIRKNNTLKLSDTCRVVYESGGKAHFDFVVCALPLGVLKRGAYQQRARQKMLDNEKGIHFYPPLPKTKQDAIENVGFGLLNKVFVQFPHAFWRKAGTVESLSDTPFLAESQRSFGNVSGKNPHHYMFFDVGRCVNELKAGNEPAILMTLISGSEAVEAEKMSETSLVNDIMFTLIHLFSTIEVPMPTTYKITKWGSDKYSCGSYTFLPPGTSDQDYQILQSPINASGELISGTGKGDMRLFWAGEHTSLLFPSVAHGAFHSGTRAAKDVFDNINIRKDDTALGIDRQIPTSVYRERHPSHPVICGLCSLPDSKEQGAIVAFQRGSRNVLVHSRCAEYSPEVDMRYGVWKHVIKAVSRGKLLKCSGCGLHGATIGCQDRRCTQNNHVHCCEGWDFVKNGKEFRCALHRPQKQHDIVRSCFLCHKKSDTRLGKLIGFKKGKISVMVHFDCFQYTNIVDIQAKDPIDKNDKQVFEAISQSKNCFTCKKGGATIKCFVHFCANHAHIPCLETGGWEFKFPGKAFFCALHTIGTLDQTQNQGNDTILELSTSREPRFALQEDKMTITHNLPRNGVGTIDSKATERHSGDGVRTKSSNPFKADNMDVTESLISNREESEGEIEGFNLSGRASSLLHLICRSDENITI